MVLSNSPPRESRAGDGAQVSVTEARSGVRRGLYKVLLISSLLAIIALAIAWLAQRTPVTEPRVQATTSQPAPGG